MPLFLFQPTIVVAHFSCYQIRNDAFRSWDALAAVTAANSNEPKRDDSSSSPALTTRLQIEMAQSQSRALYQHAGTCAAMSATLVPITWQATSDWRRYRKYPTLEQMEAWILAQRRPFFLRSPVLMVAFLSFGAVEYQLGCIRLWYWPEY